jgi:sugar-specific transcriptional regulator TrmB
VKIFTARLVASLTEKGVMNPSLDSSTVYAAVDIKIALDAALKKFENELHEMEMTKQELQKLLNQRRFRPSDEFPTYKPFKTVNDVFFIYSASFRVCSL